MGSILKALNLSVFSAFWLSFLEPGVRILESALGIPLRDGLPDSDKSLLHAFLDFFVLAFVWYFFLRLTPVIPPITRWLRVTPATHTQLLVANALIVSMFFLAASGDPSAGIVFVLFLGLPAVVLSLTGTMTLLFQTAASHESANPTWRKPISAIEVKSALFIALIASFVLAGPVFLSSNSGVQLLLKNRDWITENCNTAGVKISRKFSGALFIDASMERYLGQWKLPGMKETGYKDIKRSLVDDVGVLRTEWKAFDYQSKTSKFYAYQQHNLERQAIESPSANYVISAKRVVDKELTDTRKVFGETIAVSEIATGQQIATFTYFASSYPPAYCGQRLGEFDLLEFIAQAYEK